VTSHAILQDLVLTILAGGSGTRLWPVSRAQTPKHLVPLLGADSLLQQTLSRNAAIAEMGRTIVVGAQQQADLIRRQLEAVDPSSAKHMLVEPAARNTAAAVAIAALKARDEFGPDSILFVCPSDHLIQRPEVLHEAVRAGMPAARAGKLVTFGIQPSRPETGFGWIERGDELKFAKNVHQVSRFVEKPDRATAAQMLQSGGFLWNSGMFLLRAQTILEEIARYTPQIATMSEAAYRKRSSGREIVDAELFGQVPSQPIDKAVMERSEHVAVIPCDPKWSDLGSWQAIWETLSKDHQNNAIQGDGIAEQASGNLIKAEKRLVAVAGVDDLAVVETGDAVLVMKLDNSEAVKAVVARLADADRSEIRVPGQQVRDWGQIEMLGDRHGAIINELRLDPSRTASRSGPAHLVRLTGHGFDDRGQEIAAGYSRVVETGATASLTNASTGEPLILAEIAFKAA